VILASKAGIIVIFGMQNLGVHNVGDLAHIVDDAVIHVRQGVMVRALESSEFYPLVACVVRIGQMGRIFTVSYKTCFMIFRF
jgi:hypothetical protein